MEFHHLTDVGDVFIDKIITDAELLHLVPHRGEGLDDVVLGLDARDFVLGEAIQRLRGNKVLVDEHEHPKLFHMACQSRPR